MSEDGLRRTLADWIMDAALGGADMADLVTGAAMRVHANGVPLWRAHVTYRTLHPSFESVSLIWRRGHGVTAHEMAHGSGLNAAWLRSPFAYLIDNRVGYMRRHLTGPEKLLDFPVLADLEREGATDYFASIVHFDSPSISMAGGRPDGIATSWVTDRPDGFAEDHIEALQHMVRQLAVACKLAIREQIARNVARAYLGATAGQQVLNGHIRLGDYETIEAVVWNCDLRDSTGRIERLGMSRYLALLNGFLQCAAGAVQEYGGEILAYPGDGVLAIFRHADGRCSATAALEAAAEFRRRLHDVNANLAEVGAEPLRAGLGIHRGNLAFGNIGTGGRQSFTAIGPAVNVVNRLEAMTKDHPFSTILTSSVAADLPEDRPELLPLSTQQVRGSEIPLTLFGLGDAALLPYHAPQGYIDAVLRHLPDALQPA
jgi:adenylate cyclase